MEKAPEVSVLELEKGIRMDIVLSEPSAPKPVTFENAGDVSPTTTAEDIQKKLDDAAQRRKSLMQERQESLAAHLSKIEDIHKRKQEKDEQFITSTKVALEQKLETAEENRITMLNDLKTKVKDELAKIQKHQESKEHDDLTQAKALMSNIQGKLEAAAANRDQNLQSVVKRVREHEESVNKCLLTQKEQLTALKDKINSQLQKADENREAKLQEIVSAAKEHEKKVEAVKQKKEAAVGQ